MPNVENYNSIEIRKSEMKLKTKKSLINHVNYSIDQDLAGSRLHTLQKLSQSLTSSSFSQDSSASNKLVSL